MEEKGEPIKKLAKKLTRAMEAAGVSQAELARASGMKPTAISRVLSGTQKLYFYQAAKIAEILDVDLGFLADDKMDEPVAGLTQEEKEKLRITKSIPSHKLLGLLLQPLEQFQYGDPQTGIHK